MISLRLTIDNRMLSGRISTYNVADEVTYAKVVTTLSGKEVFRNKKIRKVLTFSLFPYSDSTAMRDYEILKQGEYAVTYTDPNTFLTETRVMRLVSNLESVYLLDSVNGNRYYKGGNIVLRAVEVE